MNRPALPAVIADLQITVHRQGSSLWYAIRTPSHQFTRIGRQEYLVASLLDGQRTADEIVATVHEFDADATIVDDDVLKIVSWLSKTGLLDVPSAAAQDTRAPAKLSINPIYCKFPLVNGRYVERLGAWFAPLLCVPVLAVALLIWLVAGISVLAHWERFVASTRQLFVSDSYLWWGIAWLVLKSAHELGHAVMAVRVGSHIRSAGISLVFMAPVPFVDLTDLWTISNRWHRILCCAGGMLFEMTLAAVAALVALSTDNLSLQYFCCALATMGTLTTLAFNASPLIRFDGYYIVSDLINYPNLYTDAQLAVRQLIGKCLHPWQPTQHRMSLGLVMYGLACFQYRIVMMLSLAVGTILMLQGVGVALVAWGTYASLVVPWMKSRTARLQQLENQPAKQSSGNDAVSAETSARLSKWWETMWGGAVVAAVCWLGMIVPSPVQPAIPGYIALRDPHIIRSDTDGFVTEVLVAGESQVAAGDLIVRLSNPELELELALKRNEIISVEETIRLKRAQGRLAELQASQAELESLKLQVAQLKVKVAGLEVRSPTDGQLVQNDLPRMLGLFLTAGEPLATVARVHDFEVLASASQHDVAQMRAVVGSSLKANISGGGVFEGLLEKVEPRANDTLKEPLLAAIYGGPIAVQLQKNDSGEEVLKLTQPRFELHVRLEDEIAARLVPGQLIWLRTPGRSASLLDALQRWCELKWREIVRQSPAVS